ncbi:MAG: 1,4-alpha-glucan branching protein GlgB [Pseudohongiellaceae bacterium]
MNSQVKFIPDAVAAALVQGSHSDPFSVLGPHRAGNGAEQLVRVFQPGADAIDVVSHDGKTVLARLNRIHSEGLFEGVITQSQLQHYQLLVHFPLTTLLREDPYRFGSGLQADDLHLFHEGRHERVYEFLGSNKKTIDGVEGIQFAVWAPNARRVAVIGDFNNWDDRVHGMRLHFKSGIWEIFLPGVQSGEHYKYAIYAADGTLLPLKSDPYARYMELRPGTASRVSATESFQWQDPEWMQTRGAKQHCEAAISIYEVHPGSWRRGSTPEELLNYRALADLLIPYVKDLGFTHIQLMPVNEHPFEGSWGYQPVGMFAPSCRFGNANDFRYLVDLAHRNDIGVLLDWVPGHFPADEHGLGRFDGTHLYEHSDPRQGFHPDWKTYIFNYDRPEVVSYLLSNALYWLEEFHIDGLRFDAVASMLYLDYSRKEGEWLPNHYGGRENLAAIAVLRLINTRAYQRHNDIMMVAEESTAWPGVTRFADSGGLGFGFKWNLGWMNDTLGYMQRDPIHRQYHHNDMTFGLLYAFSENFILPLSHDEVVHGKRALLEKMPGDDWQKFASLRAYLAFMWGHPGKKLLFMGGEFGQRAEWNHDLSLDWHLLQYPAHSGLQKLVRDLNGIYVRSPALWRHDSRPQGFEWIAAGENTGAMFIFMRRCDNESDVIVISNFTPTLYEHFRFGVPAAGVYRECINTNSEYYGGTNHGNLGMLKTEQIPSHGRPFSLGLVIPPLGTVILKRDSTPG